MGRSMDLNEVLTENAVLCDDKKGRLGKQKSAAQWMID